MPFSYRVNVQTSFQPNLIQVDSRNPMPLVVDRWNLEWLTLQLLSVRRCARERSGIRFQRLFLVIQNINGKVSISIHSSLVSSNSFVIERSLETHDLAFTLPKYRQEDKQQFFRLLLLSSSDLADSTTTVSRIERLYHQSGGRHVGIVFLVSEKKPGNNGTFGYVNLQVK